MAAPPWTGMSFTSTVHSTVPSALDPSRQRLPCPFVVCITGASRNIGAATAKAFAQAGATGLVLTATSKSSALIETKKECETLASSPSLKVSMLAANAGDPSSAQRIADTVMTEHGRLDLLINNAAIVSTHESAFNKPESVNVDQIQRTMDVNFVGKFATIRSLLPILLRSDGGAKSIVNITSAMSHFASTGAVGYNISELATNRLTEAVAECYREEGVLVYAVHPGIVATLPAPIGMPPEGRAWATDDVGLCGAFLVWLVKERREWLSGRYLSANWDVGELEGKMEEIVGEDKLKMRMVV